mgnify:FL=1
MESLSLGFTTTPKMVQFVVEENVKIALFCSRRKSMKKRIPHLGMFVKEVILWSKYCVHYLLGYGSVASGWISSELLVVILEVSPTSICGLTQ